MKTKYTFCILSLALALVAPFCAQAQDNPYVVSTQTFTNSVSPNTTATIAGAAVKVRGNQGIAVLPQYNLTGAGTGNVTFYFQASADGTNWTTVSPWSYILPASGTSTVRGYINLAPVYSTSASPALNNVRFIRLNTVSNDTANTGSVTNLTFTWSQFAK